jgi:hypothetical protein
MRRNLVLNSYENGKVKTEKELGPKEEKSGRRPIIRFGNISTPPPWEGGGGGGGGGPTFPGNDPFPGGDPDQVGQEVDVAETGNSRDSLI